MLAKLIIASNLDLRAKEIEKILLQNNLHFNHPDLLILKDEQKLGIEQTLKIKKHFSFKPHQALGKAVIVESAHKLTVEAQNALLKTLEELPSYALILLGANSTENLLPTILSRCQIVRLKTLAQSAQIEQTLLQKYSQDFIQLESSSIQERFEYIEKIKDKEEFLEFLIIAFHQKLLDQKNIYQTKQFLEHLLEAQKWQKQNVNIRGILEYLMLYLESSY